MWYLLASVFFALLGTVWLKYPQKLFYIRNWPGVSKDAKMNEAGVKMYQILGLVHLLAALGFFGLFVVSL
jgi:hypothetical protein